MHDSNPRLQVDDQTTRAFAPDSADGATKVFRPGYIETGTLTGAGSAPVDVGPPPEGVPGYAIIRELGRGGMGVVYLAKQVGLNRDVALKMVLAGGHASAAERIRFLAEAEAIASIQHSGIVQVFDFGTHAGQPFFALEFVPGGSLADSLQTLLPDARAAASLIEKLARAMQAAHEKGIIHRDLKPSNILLAADKSPKITDFGLARKTDSGSGLTQTGAVLGTPSYMSPEQAAGQHHQTGPATDVYALGAILYECLTGRPPFRAASAVETVQQVLRGEPVPLTRLVPKLPRDLETICLKCLEKEPVKRYASAASLADDLERFLTGNSILARPVPAWERTWRWARRRPGLAASILAAVAALGTVVAVVLVKNAQLQTERDAARSAQREADIMRLAATTSAESAVRAYATASLNEKAASEERKKAQARLEKAVEAVEQVMMRVAGEKWALRPELQNERREVLEEAVAFFNGLGSEEGKDPTVRRQAARANLFAAAAYVSLSEYDAGRTAAQASVSLYRGLQGEFPTDSTFLRGEAEATALLGHTDAILARFTDALGHYDNVLKLAQKAVALEPEREENQLALADSYASLALFFSFQRPDLSRQYHAKALEIGELLVNRPAPGFKARLVVVTALVNLAVGEMGTSQAAATEKLQRAEQQVRLMENLPPPSARSAETYICSKAGLSLYRGVLLVRSKKIDEGLKSAKSGIETLEKMLVLQPKSFPFQIQHLQFQLVYADMLLNNGREPDAREVLAAVDREQKEIVRQQPQLAWVRGMGQLQKSLMLIHNLRAKYDPAFEDEAKQLLEVGTSYTTPAVKYNVACLYAQAAILAPVAERTKHADRAMTHLQELLTKTDYFSAALNSNHLDKDTDLDPLRGRLDFRSFLSTAKAQAGIRESAPAPRKVELE